jgi:hypothetical protein
LKDANPAAEPLALTRAIPALPKIPVSRYPAASCFSANDFLQPQGRVLKPKDRFDSADLDKADLSLGGKISPSECEERLLKVLRDDGMSYGGNTVSAYLAGHL